MTPEGYPDDDELRTIAKWDWHDLHGLMAYVQRRWHYGDWGWTQDGNRFTISTGGWSGNEDLMRALKDNTIFWCFCWESSRRGGHYVVEIPKTQPVPESPHAPA